MFCFFFTITETNRTYTDWRPRSRHDALPICPRCRGRRPYGHLPSGRALLGLRVRNAVPCLFPGPLSLRRAWVGRDKRVLANPPIFPNPHARHDVPGNPPPVRGEDVRSEEHTSELQSLMRISYAVFCLKKKKHTH